MPGEVQLNGRQLVGLSSDAGGCRAMCTPPGRRVARRTALAVAWSDDKLDEAWRSRGVKNRMELFRGALGHYLKQLGG